MKRLQCVRYSVLLYNIRHLCTVTFKNCIQPVRWLFLAPFYREGNRSSEGNGTPLQYSCLENPMDGGAWWAAVHGSLRVGHDWATSLSLFTFMHWRRKWQPTPVLLPGESQGRGSLVGHRLWGRRVGHDWSDLAAAAAANRSSKGCSNVFRALS